MATSFIVASPHGFATLQPFCMASCYTVTPPFLFKASFRMGLPLVTAASQVGSFSMHTARNGELREQTHQTEK